MEDTNEQMIELTHNRLDDRNNSQIREDSNLYYELGTISGISRNGDVTLDELPTRSYPTRQRNKKILKPSPLLYFGIGILCLAVLLALLIGFVLITKMKSSNEPQDKEKTAYIQSTKSNRRFPTTETDGVNNLDKGMNIVNILERSELII